MVTYLYRFGGGEIKILMLLNKLDIGGAETHVIDLSVELKKRGHVVEIASNGGAYESLLSQNGIKHITLPLHNKNPLNMLRSYNALKRLIKSGGYTIIHAHSRIPAFLCGILKRRYSFNFITTAHWVFNPTPLYRLLSDWGKRAVAVSADIKEYLVKYYDFNPEHITVTINGIDTERYRPMPPDSALVEELGLEPIPTIVCLSRMDASRSMAAHMLCEVVKRLTVKTQVVLVGDGDDYENLLSVVEQTNKQLGRRAVITTGKRLDAERFASIADIFVNVSRSVLEAMACGKPVIVTGNEGYIGILSEENVDIARETNYCCRGCPAPSVDAITRDVEQLLAMSEEQIAALGQFNREVILREYSVARMTNDYMAAYSDLLSNPRVLISGYYGYNNAGDDALLAAILSNIKEKCPSAQFTVLSNQPSQTIELYSQYAVDSIYRFNIFALNESLANINLLISGGGSLIQDGTSTRSMLYYLWVILAAKRKGVPVMLYANGIGPVNIPKNRRRAAKVLNNVDYITLRESDSVRELKEMGVNRPPIELTADPVFGLVPSENATKPVLDGLKSNERYFSCAVRPWKHMEADAPRKIAEFCDYAADKYKLRPIFILMQGVKDLPSANSVTELMKVKPVIVTLKGDAGELLSILKGAEFAISMRLHTLIYAARAGVPLIALSYDPKVTALMHELEMPYCQPVDNIDADLLKQYVDDILINSDSIKKRLAEKCGQLSERVKRDAEIAVSLINSIDNTE